MILVMRPHGDLACWRHILILCCVGALLGAVGARTCCKTDSARSVLWMPAMNTFRRLDANSDTKATYDFYSQILGFTPLETYDVGNGTDVWRIQAGASQIKLSRRNDNRTYVEGAVTDATGLRLWTFFFTDPGALLRNFTDAGLEPPAFEGTAPTRRWAADFVGLEWVGEEHDVRFDTTKHVFRHGATYVALMSFEKTLPADTGTGGIQYVVSDVDRVQQLAKCQDVSIIQEIETIPGYPVRTVWLEDPDGIINYFAETAESRGEEEEEEDIG
ncbi:unnamed protein product [Parascedosporium putredinis]|uniref:VOC domain-containing protein n=1 Tax=Parascedosporium putredinis TaxID=1442378 RepID=A0A9P1M8B9_9PEZI|nr:unnamed protein product [Parascedosporium putredinis]CAI7993333.1 unnamed protein product [Parascedosporium putredinis]